MKRIAFIGGDARMIFAARAFERDGYGVAAFGFDLAAEDLSDIAAGSAAEALAGAEYAVLPPLVSRDGENVYAPLSSAKIPLRGLCFGGAAVYGGKCRGIDAEVKNYAAREVFAVRNAVPTAEGAIKIAMEATGSSICGMRACVLGFGRIGAVLSRDLAALGARVDAFARRSEARALARSFGAEAYDFGALGAHIGSYDCIFNTVPERVLGESELKGIKRGAPFIELASAPGGADEELVRALGVKFVPAGGLPGKIMPAAAGKIVYETVKEMMEEETV
jgi:dipicolinate synthase subunit A